MWTSPDVAVIGAGPVGCVTALAFAQRGARVALLEAQAQASRRLAGEWLHPRGVAVLQQLGLTIPATIDHPAGQGFVVFAGHDEPPVVLPYPEGEALTCEHGALVAALRDAAMTHPSIRLVSSARVVGIDGQRLHWSGPDGAAITHLSAPLLVGADGRASLTRRSLDLPDGRVLLSHMAGVRLEDAELPFENHGHVLLGGPGPMFACRISPRQIRLCLDVPVRQGVPKSDPEYLWKAYSPALPPGLRPAFRRALATQPVAWTANQWRPRRHYGREGLALVGDAVGHFHPLTAAGMTLGFTDGVCLAASKGVAAYRRARCSSSTVAELLAMGLYQLFTREDDGTLAMRQAVYRMWREAPADRRRTMRLLSGEETALIQFNQALLKVVFSAAAQVLWGGVWSWELRQTARTLWRFGDWLPWLARRGLPHRLAFPTIPEWAGQPHRGEMDS